MTNQRIPVTADTALFTYYDIESLANVFSLVAYTPRPNGIGALEVFYLVDDAADGTNLSDAVDLKALGDAIFQSNPGLPAFPQTQLRFWDLRLLEEQHLARADHRPLRRRAGLPPQCPLGLPGRPAPGLRHRPRLRPAQCTRSWSATTR